MHWRPAGRAHTTREEHAIEPNDEIEVGAELEEKEPSFPERLWRTEPALIRAVAAAALSLVIAYGAPISPEQKLETLGFIGALVALWQGWSTRQSVYSPASVDAIDDEADAAVENAYLGGYSDAMAFEAGVNRAPVG